MPSQFPPIQEDPTPALSGYRWGASLLLLFVQEDVYTFFAEHLRRENRVLSVFPVVEGEILGAVCIGENGDGSAEELAARYWRHAEGVRRITVCALCDLFQDGLIPVDNNQY